MQQSLFKVDDLKPGMSNIFICRSFRTQIFMQSKIMNLASRVAHKTKCKKEIAYQKTIKLLKKKKFGLQFINKLNNIINLSDITLNHDEKSVLHHGLKFCIPHKHITFEEVCSQFEVLAGQLQSHKPISKPEKKTLYVTLS